MIIPQNGKIIILDDKPEQAMPLIQQLSLNKIPFTYYSGKLDQLPGSPFEDVRMVFIDINLTDGTNEQTIMSQLQRTLKRLIKPNSTYVAAIWSIKENEHENLIAELFDNRIPELKPILRVSLAKQELFTIDVDTGNYIEDPEVDVIAKINSKLEQELSKMESLKALVMWENIVSECTGKSVHSFSNMIEKDAFWNDNIRHVFYKLAHAQLGKNLFNSDEQHIVRSMLKTLNSNLIDLLDDEINSAANIPTDLGIKSEGPKYTKEIAGFNIELKWEDLKTNILSVNGVERSRNVSVAKLKTVDNNQAEQDAVETFKKTYGSVSPSLNSALLLSFSSNPALHPGNVYSKVVTGTRKRKLLKTYFKDIDKKRHVQGQQSPVFEILDISNFKFVELECTPTCDYSQNKWLRSRILPGIMYPAEFEKNVDKNTDTLYRELPTFIYRGIQYQLIFDYRLFKSINLENDTNVSESFLFKLKPEVLVDLQAKISSHVNRPGITTIS